MRLSSRVLGGPREPGVRTAARVATVGIVVSGVLAASGLSALAATGRPGSGATHVRGTVERLTLDNFTHPLAEGHDVLTVVRSGGSTVQVPEADLADVPTGATVDVALASTAGTRVTAQGGLATDLPPAAAQDPSAGADVASVQVVSTPAPGTSSTGSGVAATNMTVAAGVAKHDVLVVVAQPAGGPAPTVTASQVAATVNNGVDSYWTTVTGGAVGFTATAYPSVVTTTNVPCSAGGVSTSGAFWNEVETKAHWTSGSGKHLVVYFASFADCGGIAGLGTIGSGTGSGGVIWSNGYNNVGVIGHELGHNLGLGHSQELDCTVNGVRVMDAPPASCSARSYWDVNDIMALSWNYQGFLNGSHLRRLGILDSTSQATPTGNGQVTLAPLETATGLRVLTLSDGATHYVVEYRQPIGLDSWLATTTGWGSAGVTIRREFDLAAAGTSSFSAIESYVVDGNPASADTSLGAVVTSVPEGVWLDLDGGRLGLRITASSAAGATIEYRNGPASGDPRYVAPPRPVLSPPVASVGLGSVRPLRTGPVLPLRWSWRVTTPAIAPATAAAVRYGKAVAPARAGLTTWVPTAYRASAVASDGAVVSRSARAYARYLGETNTRVATYSRGWTSYSSSTAMGSRLRATAKRGAAVALKVTGRSIGILLASGVRYGKVAVYVDGHRMATLNLHTTSSRLRLAWARSFPTLSAHTIRLVNLTGGTRGNIGFDGVVTLR